MRATTSTRDAASAAATLRDKYAVLIALRLAEEGGCARPPKATFVALSTRFPGALRELDRRALDDLRDRYRCLDDVALGRADLPEWARFEAAYHGLTRVALGLKVAMATAERPDVAASDWLRQRAPAQDEPAPEYWSPQRLAQLRRPPKGRLSALTAAWAADLAAATSDLASAEALAFASESDEGPRNKARW